MGAQLVAQWNGVQRADRVTKMKRQFRGYFQFAKNWLDQKKTRIMTQHFWLPLFSLIEAFVERASSLFFSERFPGLQRQYCRYLTLLILENLFKATFKLPNTRAMWLVPAGYYAKIAESLRVDLKRSSGKRKEVLTAVKAQLPICKQQFEQDLLRLHIEVENHQPNPEPEATSMRMQPISQPEPMLLQPMANLQLDSQTQPVMGYGPYSAHLRQPMYLPQLPVVPFAPY